MQDALLGTVAGYG